MHSGDSVTQLTGDVCGLETALDDGFLCNDTSSSLAALLSTSEGELGDMSGVLQELEWVTQKGSK